MLVDPVNQHQKL